MNLSLIISGILGLIIGSFFGHYLAKRGITADNALTNHQTPARLTFLGITVIVTFFVIVDKLHLYYQVSRFIPVMLTLWLQANFDYLLFGLTAFVLGLLLFLEISGWSSPQRRNQLLLGLSVITCALVLLNYLFSPIVGLIKPLQLSQEVVLQTTHITCAPASIATLARATGKYINITEKETAILAKTNRLGTSTLREISALKQLNLNPDYQYQLTVEDLMKRNQMALLHVQEKVGKNKFPHAVALLGIEANPPTFIIGNPLFGIDKRPLEKMKDYWFGEAIFIDTPI